MNNSQIKRVEEEDQVFSFVVRKADLLKLSTDNSIATEVRGGFGQSQLRHCDGYVLKKGAHKNIPICIPSHEITFHYR